MTWLFITQNTVKSIDLVRHDLNLHAGCVEINTIVQLKQTYPFIFLYALNALYSVEKVQKCRQAITDACNQKCRDVARQLWNWTKLLCPVSYLPWKRMQTKWTLQKGYITNHWYLKEKCTLRLKIYIAWMHGQLI